MNPEKPEGQITSVKYGKNKYKAKIVKKSDDKIYLNNLKVTKEGEILKKNVNSSSKLAQSLKDNLKKKSKAADQKKTQNAAKESENLIKMKNIIESSGTEDSDVEKSGVENSDAERSDCEDSDPKEDGISAEESDNEPAAKKIKKQSKDGRLQPEKNITPRTSSPSPTCSTWPDPTVPERRNDNSSPLLESPEDQESNMIPRTAPRRVENRNHIPAVPAQPTSSDENNEDPLITCRRAGEGRMKLCSHMNVWIDKGDLTYIQRWTRKPREMTRQLMKHLVGVNNLITMCARGKSGNRRAIPRDIMNCVEHYVNKKCETKLSPAEFTDVVNLLIGTLRHPKTK